MYASIQKNKSVLNGSYIYLVAASTRDQLAAIELLSLLLILQSSFMSMVAKILKPIAIAPFARGVYFRNPHSAVSFRWVHSPVQWNISKWYILSH